MLAGMTAKDFIPYLVPLLVGVLILRRSARARKINLTRMWIAPVIFSLSLAATLAVAPLPGPLVIASFVAAAVLGGTLGYARARHQKLVVDPATGRISSEATTVESIIVLGLFVLRFGFKQMFPQTAAAGHGGQVAVATTGLLFFTLAMLIAQSYGITARARPLLAAHKAQKAVAAPDASPTAQTSE